MYLVLGYLSSTSEWKREAVTAGRKHVATVVTKEVYLAKLFLFLGSCVCVCERERDCFLREEDRQNPQESCEVEEERRCDKEAAPTIGIRALSIRGGGGGVADSM